MHKRELRSLLCAMLLGDSCLHKASKVSNSARLSTVHGGSQKDYMLWKAEQLDRIFREKGIGRRCRFVFRVIHDDRTGKDYSQVRSTLSWDPYLRTLRTRTHKFISGVEQKDVEYLLAQLSSDLHLAIWFGDDGTENRHRGKTTNGGVIPWCTPSLKLCTDSFTEGQQRLIQQWFAQRYGVNAIIYWHGAHQRLRFSVEDSTKLFLRFGLHLSNIESMRQKFWLSFARHYGLKKECIPQEG